MTTYNWMPESYEEFRSAAAQGRVQLDILPKQYSWLYANILPFAINKKYDYNTRLLREMLRNPQAFRSVHAYGVDLVLHKEPVYPDGISPNYRQDFNALALLTAAALIWGLFLWSDDWPGLVVYLLPCAAFAIIGSFINVRKDDYDQSGPWSFPFLSLIWPIPVLLYIISGDWKNDND